MGSDIFAFTGPQLTRNFLLSLRTPTTRDRPDVILPFTSPQTTTLTPDTTQSYLKGRRSGRRAFHVSQDHQKLYYRRPIGNRYHKNHIIHRINRIQKKLETRRTPPSRGVPEAHFGANKEGPPQGGQKRPSLGAPTNGESGVLSTGRGEGLAPQKGESGWAPPIHLPPRPDKPLKQERSGLSKQCFGSTSTNAKSRNPPTTQPQRHLPTTPNCTLPHKTSSQISG